MSFLTPQFPNFSFQSSEERKIERIRFDGIIDGFNDQMTKRISWAPLKMGGINFLTHTLSEDKYGNLRYRVVFRAIALFLIIIGIELIILKAFLSVNSTFAALREMGLGILFPLIIIIFPVIYSVYKIITFTRKVSFDFQTGYIHIGGICNRIFNSDSVNKDIPIQEIYAVQILCEKSYFDQLTSSYIKSPHFFLSYEINLILRNTKRINIIDGGDLAQILLDARKIADHLRVPLWDMTSFCDLLSLGVLPDGIQEQVTKI